MHSEIGRKLHHLSFGKLKMAEDDIARLLQNVDFDEILPDERNADGINVDKQQVYKM
jgi:hypothetical protein